MRLIKSNNIKSEYPKRVFCDECQAELEVEESDVFVGEFGCGIFLACLPGAQSADCGVS